MPFFGVITLAATLLLTDQVRWPQAITTGTADDYSPSATPDGKSVVYVSTRRGNPDLFIRYLPGSGSVGDYPLTFHTARDFSPAVSPTGEQVVFVSTRDDSRGDLYLVNLRLAEKIPELIRERLYQQYGSILSKPDSEVASAGTSARITKYLLSQGQLVRLTNGGQSESEPAWAPSGDKIYFGRMEGKESGIYVLTLPSRETSFLTQGSMPAPSPDGTSLAYVKDGSIYVFSFATKNSRKLTSGPFDASPSWNQKGDALFFSRFADDTNKDGRVTLADNAAIFSISTSGKEMDQNLHRLTAGNRSDLFPTFSNGRIIFSSTRSSGAGLSHLMSFDAKGWFPETLSIKDLFSLSHQLENSDPRTAALVLSEISWRSPSDKAEAQFYRGKIFEGLGDKMQATQAWLTSEKASEGRWRDRSKIERIRLELEGNYSNATVSRAVEKWRAIAVGSKNDDVRATALLAEGRAWLRIHDEANGIRALDTVVQKYPNEVDAAAPAMLEKVVLYRKFGETEKLLRGYSDLLRKYPNADPWSDQAAEEAVNATLLSIKNESDRDARLRMLATMESKTPVLPAHALNRLGERQLAKNEKNEAETTLRSVLAQFPNEKREGARAKLTLSRILVERGDYDEALALYREAEAVVPVSDPWRTEAKRRFVGNLLAKGRGALAGKDPRLAIRTFRDLIAFDPSIVQAHRGLIASYASVGETDQAISIYRDEVKKNPDYYLPRYCLGLAYTYVEPPSKGFDLAQPHLEQAVAMNGQALFPHQTLGFVLEKREELLKESDQLERAIDEYSIARTLNDPNEDFQNYSDLTLNLGNGYFLLKDYSKALDYYAEREKLDSPFDPAAQKLVFLERYARSAFHMGDFPRAEKLLAAAGKLLVQLERDLEIKGRELLSHRAEQTDLRALTLAEGGKHAEAAEAFGKAAELNRALGEPSNEAKALRNMAIHLFDSPTTDPNEREKALANSRDTFDESLALLGEHGARTTKTKKTGSLYNLDMEVALDGDTSEAAKGFTTQGEKDLIYTFVGRIDRERGDDRSALESLDRKVAMLPAESSIEETKRPAFLLKRSILQNQRGVSLFRLGQFPLAATAFRSSIADARTIRHESGLTLNALSMARLHFISPETVPANEAASLLDEAWSLARNRNDDEANQLAARIALERLRLGDWIGAAEATPSPLTKILQRLRESRPTQDEGLALEVDLAHFEWSGHRAIRIPGRDSLAAIIEEAKKINRPDLALQANILNVRMGGNSLDNLLSSLSGTSVRGLEKPFADLLPLLQNQIRENLQKKEAEKVYIASEWSDRIRLALALAPIPIPMGENLSRGVASLSAADIIDAAELQEMLGPNRVFLHSLSTDGKSTWLLLKNDGIELLEPNASLPAGKDTYVTDRSLCPKKDPCGVVRSGAHLFYSLSAQPISQRRWLSLTNPSKAKEWLTWSDRKDFESKIRLADVFVAPKDFILSPSDSPFRLLFVDPNEGKSSYDRILPARLLLGSGVTTLFLPPELHQDLLLAEGFARGGVATVRTGDSNANSVEIVGALGWKPEERKEIAKERLNDLLQQGAVLYKEGRFNESVRIFEQAIDILDAEQSDASREAILDAASTASWKGDDIPRAIGLAEKLVQFRKKNNSPTLADSLQFLGILYSRAERYPESVKALEEATTLYRKGGATEKVASTLATRGIILENASRYKEALSSFDQSLSIYSKKGGSETAEQWRRIGRIYYLRLNDYSQAKKAFRQAADLFAKAKDETNRDEAELELGLVEERRALFDHAREIDQAVFVRAEKRKDRAVSGKAALFTANTYWYQGSYFEAFQWQRKALEIAEETKNERLEMLAHSTKGLIDWTVNRYDSALREQEKSKALSAKLVSPIDAAAAENNIGLILRDRGDLEGSIAAFDRAIAIDQKLQTSWGLSYDFRNKGISETKLRRFAAAEKNLSEAIHLAHKIGALENEAKARLSLSDLQSLQSKWSDAIVGYQEALRLARLSRLREVEWRALHGLGKAAMVRHETDEALIQYKSAIDVVEKLSAAIKIEEFRNGFMTNKSSLYEDTILALLQKGKAGIAEAWTYAERARSRNFIDLLGNRSIGASQPSDQKLLARDQENRRKIDDLEDQLAKAPNDSERTRLVNELRTARKEREELLIDLRASNPQLSSFISVDVITLDEVQRLIGLDTALVEYFLAEKEVLAWVITSEGISVARKPIPKSELEVKIVEYSRLMQEQKPLMKLSEEFYSILIEPIEKDIAQKKYVGISPYGSLHYLAFASLFDGKNYVIDRHPLFYTPSASVLKFTLQKKAIDKQNARVLAVGNPDLGNHALDLPFAEKEVGAIARQFPNIDLLTRKEATEKWVVGNIGKYQVLHFASHGEFDSINPLFSALRLAPSKGDNGELRVEDIFNLKLNADLVTLSACQTGLAKIEGGDELVGLNRSFLYAGTHSILSSLWRISDVATAVLVKRFYRNYISNSKAESLREAEILVRNYYPHPAYWASLALTGDYR